MPLAGIAGIGKIQRVHILAVNQHLQVQVRPGGISGAADLRDHIPGLYLLSGRYKNL